MLTNPFGDIGLRRHHALLDRSFPSVLKILLLAIAGIGDGTDGQDDFDQSALLDSKRRSMILRPIHPGVSKFRQNRAVCDTSSIKMSCKPFCRIAMKVARGSGNARLTRRCERTDLFDISYRCDAGA
jgi:hypothetical protein